MARSETRDEKMTRWGRVFQEAMQEPMDQRRLPWTARQVIHDGPGWQFFDPDDKPVLGDLLRDPEDAAWLLRFINGLKEDQDRATLFLALRNLLTATRRLDRVWYPQHKGNPFFQDLHKALEPYSTYWPEDQNNAEREEDDGA